MAGGDARDTSAAASALGYVAQIEYALLAGLNRLDTELTFEISLEVVDDFAFHNEQGEIELVQAKHKVDSDANLTDSSTEVWKTIYNWIEGGHVGRSLILLSNSDATPGGAMHALRPDSPAPETALSKLESIARTSTNTQHQKYYAAFLALGEEGRRSFLHNVVVLDGAPSATDMEDRLRLKLRTHTGPRYLDALVQHLRGWWIQRVIGHLQAVAEDTDDRITAGELAAYVRQFADELRAQNLPIDFGDVVLPEADDVADDDRPFVQQLRLIALTNERVRFCVHDHYRAFAQRSRWQREELLDVGEIDKYERRLIEEWKRHAADVDTGGTEEEVTEAAKAAFLKFDKNPRLPRIRELVDEPYVARGSLHILANEMRIGWHPDWVSRLRHVLEPEEQSA